MCRTAESREDAGEESELDKTSFQRLMRGQADLRM